MQLTTRVSDLDTSLTDMNRDDFTHSGSAEGDGDEDEGDGGGKGDKKHKNSYKSLIKGIPGA